MNCDSCGAPLRGLYLAVIACDYCGRERVNPLRERADAMSLSQQYAAANAAANQQQHALGAYLIGTSTLPWMLSTSSSSWAGVGDAGANLLNLMAQQRRL